MQWGTVAEWFMVGLLFLTLIATSIGTWLAFDAKKIKLEGSCKTQVLFPRKGDPRKKEKVLALSIVNHGGRPETICNLGVQVGKNKGADISAWFIVGLHGLRVPESDTLPATLGYGDRKQFRHPFASGVEAIVNAVIQKKSDAKNLRFVFHTTRGQHKSFKPNEDLVNAMIDEMGKQKPAEK